MKIFQCQACDQPISFESNHCESCERRLGYACDIHEMSALEPVGGVWHAYANPARKYRFCANAHYDACNWLVPDDFPSRYCVTCRHNHVVPDLSIAWNLTRWRQIEARQAPAVLLPPAPRPSAHDPGREPHHGPRLRLSGRPLGELPDRAAGAHGASQRPHHPEHRRGRRRRAGAAEDAVRRVLPHPARTFPARDRALFLECARSLRSEHLDLSVALR